MENTLLIGLSRQMVLERQMDVVANNVANVNTSGFKADRSLFEEFLNSRAHEDNFIGRDRRVSYVQDRGTFKDFTQGAVEQTKNPLDLAIEGDGFLVVQTPAGERYSRDGGLQINNLGQLVSVSPPGARLQRPDRDSADRQGSHHRRRRGVTSSRAATGSIRCAASCGSSTSRMRRSW
jgi:flagellar hook-basal body protein